MQPYLTFSLVDDYEILIPSFEFNCHMQIGKERQLFAFQFLIFWASTNIVGEAFTNTTVDVLLFPGLWFPTLKFLHVEGEKTDKFSGPARA